MKTWINRVGGMLVIQHKDSRGLNQFSRECTDYPLMVNCTGIIDLPMDFETLNEEGRADFYYLYLVQGALEVDTLEGPSLMQTGSVALFDPYTPYRYCNRFGKPVKYYFIHYTGAEALRFTRECDLLDHHILHIGVRESLIADLDRLYLEYLRKEEGFSLLAGGLLGEILAKTLRYGKKKRERQPFSSLEYMAKHFAEELSIAFLAEREHLSPGRYRALFSSFMGMSPKDYLTKLRLDKAMELLLGTDLAVGEIAALVGFSDPLYFSRLFHKKTGISPSDYRSHKKENAYEI